tara:strand:+ start:38748 stop:39269 length:522 start_codon:yes stop_codon:yes gene_type:complete
MRKKFKTEDFVIRSFKKGDEESLQEHINHKSVYRYTLRVPYPYTIKDAREWIERNMSLDKKKKKDEINLAIEVKGDVVGGIGFIKIEKHKAEIGYWIGKRLWNKGIMTRAVKLMTKFAFNNLKLRRIYATINPRNKGSARVLEKCGYVLEGRMKKNELKDGVITDSDLYAKVR